MILNETVAAIADAIREKTGKSELIKPIDFATEIKGITAGGGGAPSGSNVEYLELNGNTWLADKLMGGIVEMKITVENAPFPIEGMIGLGTAVYPMITQFAQMGATANIIAVSYNRDAATIMKQDGVVTTQTAHEVLVSKGESYVEAYNNVPRITKEQFYDLNA